MHLLLRIFVKIDHRVQEHCEAADRYQGSSHVSDRNANDWGWLRLAQLVLRCLVDLTEDEEELDDRGDLERAHDDIEVSCYHRCLERRLLPRAISRLALGVVHDAGEAVNWASCDDDGGAHVENSQRYERYLPLLDHDAPKVEADEDEDGEV